MQYVVADPETKRCAIVDPVLDFEEKSGADCHAFGRRPPHPYREERASALEWILDTHPHADHLSAAAYLKEKTGVPTGIGEKVVEVQKLWKDIYNLPDFPADGSQWDKLFADGERFTIGNCQVEVISLAGAYAASDHLSRGRCRLHPRHACSCRTAARRGPIFPAAMPGELWRSMQRILALPRETRLFTGHDYTPASRKPAWESTIAEQKAEATRTFARPRRRPSTSRCAKPATRRCRCRT